jgi:dGTPase
VTDVITVSDGRPVVEMSTEVATATDALKEFLFDRVYWSVHRGSGEMEKAGHVVGELFRHYMAHPDDMHGPGDPAAAGVAERALAVCDFIACMTDRYALSRFVRHFLPRGMASADSDDGPALSRWKDDSR